MSAVIDTIKMMETFSLVLAVYILSALMFAIVFPVIRALFKKKY